MTRAVVPMARMSAKLPATASSARHDGSFVLPEAPPLPGLSFRTYRGEEDLPALAEVMNEAIEANGDHEHWSVEGLRNELDNLTHVDPRQDHVLAFVGDRLVAASEIEWADASNGQRHYRSLGYVHPEWRRNGIGRAMFAHNEARLCEIAAGLQHTRPPLLTTWLTDADVGGQAIVRARGYRQAGVFHHMVRPDLDDIRVLPLPAGLEVRDLGGDDLRPLFDALIEAFADHPGGHDGSDDGFRRFTGNPAFDRTLAVVIFDGPAIAAGVIGSIDPAENQAAGYLRGWTDPVFTRRPWRRRGLASAALGRALVRLRERGMTSAQLDVDLENPNHAIRLYQQHRFEIHHSGGEWHRPVTV